MPPADVIRQDRERFARARERGETRLQDAAGVVGARYDASRDAIDLTFRGGGSIMIPRRIIPGLAEAPATAVDVPISVSPAGDALSWPSLDIDVHIPGLVERTFGARLFAAATGRRGGRRTSKAKTAAAKANGAKGGRPRARFAV